MQEREIVFRGGEMNHIDERTGNTKIILHLCADIGSDSLPYKEAVKIAWDKAIAKDAGLPKKIKKIKHYNARIWKEITGIKI